MANRSRFQQALRAAAVPLAALLATGYFGYHAFHGDHGVFAKLRLERQAETLAKELELVRQQRLALERRVSLLRSDSLDPDMLEERARDKLDYAHPDDVVILRGRPPEPAAKP